MTWATFYLVCFLVGTALSVIAFVFGGLHLTHLHFPHLHFVHWFHGHAALPDAHAPDAGSARGSLSVFNLGTITVFLAWFGATGYLLTEHSPLAALLILLFAVTLKWLPPSGYGGLRFLVLPALTLGMRSIAFLARMTRSAMLDALNADLPLS